MKFKFALILLFLIQFPFFLTAQKKFIDSSINKSKTDAAGHLINNSSDKINSGIDNVFNGSIFKKKSKSAKQENISPDKVLPEKGKTEIAITNATYTNISGLSEALKSNQQVTDVEKTFSNGTGTLKVSHNCTSDQLLDDLEKKAGDKFDVVEISEGKISLKMK